MVTAMMNLKAISRGICGLSLGAMGLAMLAAPAQGALTAYYTLDSTTTGLVNNGADGATSNLSLYAGKDDASQVNGIIGSALRFSGTTLYTTTVAGNAADDLSSMPFTFSMWVSIQDGTGARAGISISPGDDVVGNYFGLGVNGEEKVQIVRYNSTKSQIVTPLGPVLGSNWHNIVAVYNPLQSEIVTYVDGKAVALVENANKDAIGFDAAIDTLAIGGVLRKIDAPASTQFAPFSGDLDDAGLFNNALGAADAALINGLGRTSGLGLDWHEEAAALNAAALGTQALIGGQLWERVSGLAGVVGDHGGTLAGGDAFIVTGAGGNGIQVVPEPGFAAGAFGLAMLLSRRARRR